jgi:hypothetical protein
VVPVAAVVDESDLGGFDGYEDAVAVDPYGLGQAE